MTYNKWIATNLDADAVYLCFFLPPCQFHMTSFSGSLVTAVRQKDKQAYTFQAATIQLSYNLQQQNYKIRISFKTNKYHTTFQDSGLQHFWNKSQILNTKRLASRIYKQICIVLIFYLILLC
jgi:hypothetical protein